MQLLARCTAEPKLCCRHPSVATPSRWFSSAVLSGREGASGLIEANPEPRSMWALELVGTPELSSIPRPLIFWPTLLELLNAVHFTSITGGIPRLTMQTKTWLSRAVLALSLVWKGATSYTKLGSILATYPGDVVRARGTERSCFPRSRNAVGILKSSTVEGNCHAPSDQRKNGSSRPPGEGGSNRTKFLRQLVGSSVAVLACSSAVDAARASASAAGSVLDGERRGAF